MSGYDPYAPPEPYGPFRDPVDRQKYLPRTAKSANGDLSPTISIEIEYDDNGAIEDIETFTLCDDVQQLADPWSCEIPNVDGERDYLLDRLWYPVTIYVSDPRVQDGQRIQWLKGVITDIEQGAAEEQGTTIKLSGYDKGWYLGSGAPIWKNLQGVSMAELFRKLVRAEHNWGITAGTAVYIASMMRHGRMTAEGTAALKAIAANAQDQQVALAQLQRDAVAAGRSVPTRTEAALDMAPPWFTPVIIQTEPGETVGDLLMRYARPLKRLIGMAPDGTFQFFQPDYKQRPTYAFHNHRPKDDRHTRNNVLPGWRFTRAGDNMHNVVECVTTRLVKDGTDLANQANPNEGKDVGVKVDYRTAGPGAIDFRTLSKEFIGPEDNRTMGDAPLRRESFNSGDKWTLAQAKERARWKWQQELYASLTLAYPVQGISQPGPDGVWRLYCAGAMAEVYDSWNRVERGMFVSRVQFSRSRSGTSSTITLKLPDLLGA